MRKWYPRSEGLRQYYCLSISTPSCEVLMIYILHILLFILPLFNIAELFCTRMFLHISVRCCLSKDKENPAQIFSPPARNWVECNFQSTIVDNLRGRWWRRPSPPTPDYWHRHMLLLLEKVFWLFCLSFFFLNYINLTLSILYQLSFFCTLSRSAQAKDQGGKYDSWNTEDFDNSTNGIFRKVLKLFDVYRFGHSFKRRTYMKLN